MGALISRGGSRVALEVGTLVRTQLVRRLSSRLLTILVDRYLILLPLFIRAWLFLSRLPLGLHSAHGISALAP